MREAEGIKHSGDVDELYGVGHSMGKLMEAQRGREKEREEEEEEEIMVSSTAGRSVI